MSVSPGFSGLLLWEETDLTFRFPSWCGSMASRQVRQVSIRMWWFGGLRTPHPWGQESGLSCAEAGRCGLDLVLKEAGSALHSAVILCYVWLRTTSVLPCFLPVKDSSEEGRGEAAGNL